MNITTGRKFFSALIGWTWFLSGSVTVEVTNTIGIPLSSIQVESPFFVALTVKNAASMQSWPVIESLDKVHIIGQRAEAKKTDGTSQQEEEKKIIYTVIADKPGSYTFGVRQTGTQKSSLHTITVVEGSYPPTTQAPSYTLSIPLKPYVVGERIPFVLRFSTQRPDVKLVHLETVHAKNIVVGELSAGDARVKVDNEELTSIIEYKGYFYTQNAGELVIDPLRADYTTPQTHNSPFFAGFFLGMSPNVHAVYTKQQRLKIDPLPPTDLPVTALGEFSAYTAHLSSHKAKRGDALLLTLSLEGKANFDAIGAPKPTAPEGIRLYESKTSISKTPTGEKKEWEFVIQGLKEGSYTIPPQELYYFDTESRSYKKIATKSSRFVITPGPASQPKKSPQSQQRESIQPKEQKEASIQAPLQATETQPLLEIPWTLFWILMSIPLIIALGNGLYPFITPLTTPYIRRVREYCILLQAQRRVESARRAQSPKELYRSLKSSMTAYLGLPKDASLEDMSHALRTRGITKEDTHEWEQLYTTLLQYSSYAPNQTQDFSQDLFKKAHQWLARLKKLRKQLMLLLLGVSFIGSINAGTEEGALQVITFLHTVSLSIPFLIGQLAVIVTWALMWYYGMKRKKRSFVLATVLFFVSLIGWIPHAKNHYYPTLYVGPEGASLYLSPDKNSLIREKLKADEKITIAQKKDLWYYVFSSRGNGWVNANEVALKTRL